MNPFDEISVEEAIRLKEAGTVSEIIVVSVGPKECQETIRTALAMGADRGILVLHEEATEPLAVAKMLKALVEKEEPAWSSSANKRLTMTATKPVKCCRLLGWSQGTFASKVDLKPRKSW